MASKERPRKLHKSRSKRSCFPSCFGSSGHVSDHRMKVSNGNFGSEKKKKSWFSWSRFRRMRQSGRKTVPVDASTVDMPTRGLDADEEIKEEIVAVGSAQVNGKRQLLGVVSDPGVLEKARKAKYEIKKLQQESQRILPTNFSISTKDDTCQKPLTVSRRPDSRKTRSRPGSPENFKPSRKSTEISRLSGQKTDKGNDAVAGHFGPVVGMSVLMVALLILLLWGRICAIVCTSAWFYFIPRLNLVTESRDFEGKKTDSSEPDMDSEEYKKKVIMEGLLERNRRKLVVVL